MDLEKERQEAIKQLMIACNNYTLAKLMGQERDQQEEIDEFRVLFDSLMNVFLIEQCKKVENKNKNKIEVLINDILINAYRLKNTLEESNYKDNDENNFHIEMLSKGISILVKKYTLENSLDIHKFLEQIQKEEFSSLFIKNKKGSFEA